MISDAATLMPLSLAPHPTDTVNAKSQTVAAQRHPLIARGTLVAHTCRRPVADAAAA